MKVWNYTFLFLGIAVFMALGGLEVPGFSEFFDSLGLTVSGANIGDVEIDSTIWLAIFGTAGILTAVGVSSGIAIGAFVWSKDKAFLTLPIITGTIFYWLSIIVSLITYLKEYPIFGIIIGAILIPLSFGFILACVEFFMGQDN